MWGPSSISRHHFPGSRGSGGKIQKRTSCCYACHFGACDLQRHFRVVRRLQSCQRSRCSHAGVSCEINFRQKSTHVPTACCGQQFGAPGCGCQDTLAARGILAWTLRRKWALAALLAGTRLKINRLMCIGRGARWWHGGDRLRRQPGQREMPPVRRARPR